MRFADKVLIINGAVGLGRDISAISVAVEAVIELVEAVVIELVEAVVVELVVAVVVVDERATAVAQTATLRGSSLAFRENRCAIPRADR